MLFNFILFSDSDVPVEEGPYMFGLGLARGPGPGPDTGAGPHPESVPDTGAGPDPKSVGDTNPDPAPKVADSAPNTEATQDVTPKKTKSRKSHRLNSEEEEDELLAWVKDNPCLWDGRKKEFKNTDKKDKLWHDKATEKGYVDRGHIHGWWKDMKDQYVKYDKSIQNKTKDAQFFTDRQKYILDKVAFYAPCCSHRKKPVSIQSYYFGYAM